MAKTVSAQDIELQRSYILKLRENNANYAAKNGRPRLAHTETYGCQQNENDTERIRGLLKEAGFDFTENDDEADLIIYNTCAVGKMRSRRFSADWEY